MNLALITLSLAIGVTIAWIVSSRRYKGYARAGDYMQKLDDLGSRGWKSSGYAAQYTDYENNIRLHLSEHELKERMLELETLRHQLNPHLLLNTLQMLNWRLMRERKGRSDVNDTLEHLSKILAYALKPADSLVSLTEEMRYTDAYMQLQFHEGKQRTEVSWRLGGPELTDRIRVPRVIFQPILENAVKHAFIGLDRPPELAVELHAEAGDILFSVRDNGVGMSPERLEAVRQGMLRPPEDGHGIGLYNTNKRIHLLFGSRYGLIVDSEEHRGTEVTIRLPRIESGEEDK